MLEPRHRGSNRNALDTLGPAEWIYTLESSEGEHRVTVRANVTDFVEPSCVCTASGRGGGASGIGLAAGALAAALLLRRRRLA